MVFLSFLSLIPRILLGFWITHFIWNTTEKKYLLIKVFLAGPIGFGVSSLIAFLWIWLGLSLFSYVILESVFALVFTAWVLWRSRAIFLSLVRSPYSFDRPSAVWLILLFVGGLIFVIQLVLIARQYPHGRMDAWTQWNVVARFIFRGGSDWHGTFLRQLDHPDYPIFLAMTNAITWTITNKDSTWGPVTFHFLISFFTAGLLFSLLNAFKGLKQAALAVILLLTLPGTTELGMNQYPDVLVSYFCLAVAGLTVLYLSTEEKPLPWLVGLLTGLASWTKNEGQILVISTTIIWVMIALYGDRLGCRNYLLGLALPLLVVALFKIYLAPVSDLLSSRQEILERINDIERYKMILTRAGTAVWNIGYRPIGLVGLLLIYFSIVGRTPKRIPGKWAIGTVILLQLAAYFTLYVVTPYPLDWHLKTSFDRVFFHIVPIALFGIFISIASPDEHLREREK